MKIFVPTAAECKLVTMYDSCIGAFREHNANRGISWVRQPEAADIIVLLEEWGTRFWRYCETLAEDQFFKVHWDRIVTINWDDFVRGFLPGFYTSLNRGNFEPQLHRACAYPYNYNEFVATSSWDAKRNAKWLFSFRGTDLTHPIRK